MYHDAVFGGGKGVVQTLPPSELISRLQNFTLSNPSRYKNSMGFVNGEFRFTTITFRTTLKINQPAGIKEPVFDVLYSYRDSLVANGPEGFEVILFSGFDMVWLEAELGIVRGMVNGISISFPVAFLVLLASTGNIILSSFAALSIIAIVASVLGTAYYIGWALGVGEAIAGTMVIGLSVDYVVHLGHMYTVAGDEGFARREDRFIFSAERMGATVLAGAITTGGSAAVMFGCSLNFFYKLAVLLTCTVSYSILYALFFFLPMCLLLGPENKFGDWRQLFRKLSSRSQSTPENEVKVAA